MITNIEELYEAFSQVMTHKRWWDTDNKWEILLGAVLVQNTNWKNVDYALENLYHTTQFLPEKVLALEKIQLQDLIRPSGFYKGKSNTIIGLLTWLEGCWQSRESVMKQLMLYWCMSLISRRLSRINTHSGCLKNSVLSLRAINN